MTDKIVEDREEPKWVAVSDHIESFEINNAIENAEKRTDR